MTIRCLIVDDEQPARDELRFLLSGFDDVEIVGEAHSVDKAVSQLVQLDPDLVFLDIQLGARNGFEVVAATERLKHRPLFVFATAYDNYAVKAFEESAVDYLLKPIGDERLALCLQRVRKQLAEPQEDRLAEKLQEILRQLGGQLGAQFGAQVGSQLSGQLGGRNEQSEKSEQSGGPTARERGACRVSVDIGGRIQILPAEEIIYCSYEDQKITVHTRSGGFALYGISTMDRLAEHLGEVSFCRIHRAQLVNLDAIREYSPWFNGKYHLIMNDGTELTVSRSRVKDFKLQLGI